MNTVFPSSDQRIDVQRMLLDQFKNDTHTHTKDERQQKRQRREEEERKRVEKNKY